GAYEEAREVRNLAAVQEEGEDAENISQLLNSAAELVMNGEPEEALHRTLALGPDQTSRYGRSVLLWVRVCAYAQLDDQPALEEALEELDALGDDGYGAAVTGYLCADQPDAAARAYIESLQSRRTRSSELLDLQRLSRPAVSARAAQLPARPATEIRRRVNAG